MGSKRQWINDLADRFRAVDWTVEWAKTAEVTQSGRSARVGRFSMSQYGHGFVRTRLGNRDHRRTR